MTPGVDGTPPRKTVLGGEKGGAFESFAVDARDKMKPHFFVTEDHMKGSVRRFTPSSKNIDWSEPWDMLHGDGTMEYLLLLPEKGMRYQWTTNKAKADMNAKKYYQHCEGIDVAGNRLYFVSKAQQELFVLNLDGRRYEVESTKGGSFSGSPDQLVRLVGDEELLYYTEEVSTVASVAVTYHFYGRNA